MELKNDTIIHQCLHDKKFMLVNDGYDYLLSMPIRTMTFQKFLQIKKEIKELETEIDLLQNKNVKDIWNDELDHLEKMYKKYFTVSEKNDL